MSFKYRYRKQIITVVIIIIILCSFIFTGYNYYFKEKKIKNNATKLLESTKEKTIKVKKKEANVKEEKVNKLMVDVKGEVVNQGIYTLDSNSRVIDAINMAGGLTANANTSVLNLSKKLVDEMVIIVYSNYDVKNFEQVKEQEKLVLENCKNGYDNVSNDACIENKEDSNKNEHIIISINNASIEELMTLPGIGEAKAKSIIEYREQNGDFKSIDDIKNVSGIGDSLFDQIKENITI